jgi:hypothetical protein
MNAFYKRDSRAAWKMGEIVAAAAEKKEEKAPPAKK